MIALHYIIKHCIVIDRIVYVLFGSRLYAFRCEYWYGCMV